MTLIIKPMKMLQVLHKNRLYEFRLFEKVPLVQIIKDIDKDPYSEARYHMFPVKKGWSCNCPGSRYHHHCWHHSVLNELKNQSSIKEPWAEWAENSLLEECGKVIRN